MPTESWDDYLLEELRDPEMASGFLSEAFETGTPAEIVHAIERVLAANGATNGKGVPEELIALRDLGLHFSVRSVPTLAA